MRRPDGVTLVAPSSERVIGSWSQLDEVSDCLVLNVQSGDEGVVADLDGVNQAGREPKR